MAYCKYCGKYIPDGASCDCDAAKSAGEVKEAAETVKEKTENAVEDIKEKAENAAENIQDKVEDAKNSAAEAAENVKDKAAKAVNEARSDAAEAAEKVKEKAEEAAKKADNIAGDVAEKLPGSMKNSKGTVYIIAGIIAALLLVLIIALCSGGGAKSAVKQYVKATYDKHGAKSMYSLTLPKSVIKELKKDDKLEKMIDNYNDMVEDMIDELDGKESLPKFYKITNKEKLKNSELGRAETFFEKLCAKYKADDDDIRVTKGYEIQVKTKCKDEDGDAKYDKSSICVVKVKGDGWKVIPYPADKLSYYED